MFFKPDCSGSTTSLGSLFLPLWSERTAIYWPIILSDGTFSLISTVAETKRDSVQKYIIIFEHGPIGLQGAMTNVYDEREMSRASKSTTVLCLLLFSGWACF